MSELMPDMNAGQPAEPVQEETPSEWTGPSQEEWQDYLDFREQVNQAQQQAQQQPPQQYGQQPEFDPDDFTTAGQVQEMLNQRMAQIESFYQEQRLGEAAETARDMAHDYATSKGFELSGTDPDGNPFDFTDMVVDHANRYAYELTTKYGPNNPRVAEEAIARAIDTTFGAITAANKAYLSQQMNLHKTRLGAPREMPVSASAGQQLNDNTGGGKSLTSLVGNYFSQPG